MFSIASITLKYICTSVKVYNFMIVVQIYNPDSYIYSQQFSCLVLVLANSVALPTSIVTLYLFPTSITLCHTLPYILNCHVYRRQNSRCSFVKNTAKESDY
jgi:hypothetical protein